MAKGVTEATLEEIKARIDLADLIASASEIVNQQFFNSVYAYT